MRRRENNSLFTSTLQVYIFMLGQDSYSGKLEMALENTNQGRLWVTGNSFMMMSGLV